MSQFVHYPLQLLRVRDRQPVEAQLCSIQSKHLDDFERHWKPVLLGSLEEDQYWDWKRKNRIYGSSAGAEAYAIECEQMTQGLMLIKTLGHRSWFESFRRVVYVHFLATAPWNRPSVQDPPRYRLSGTLLLRFARQRSEEVGYLGLVGLHALPEAEHFYRRMGMIDCGLDARKDNLTYFEWYQRQTREGED